MALQVIDSGYFVHQVVLAVVSTLVFCAYTALWFEEYEGSDSPPSRPDTPSAAAQRKKKHTKHSSGSSGVTTDGVTTGGVQLTVDGGEKSSAFTFAKTTEVGQTSEKSTDGGGGGGKGVKSPKHKRGASGESSGRRERAEQRKGMNLHVHRALWAVSGIMMLLSLDPLAALHIYPIVFEELLVNLATLLLVAVAFTVMRYFAQSLATFLDPFKKNARITRLLDVVKWASIASWSGLVIVVLIVFIAEFVNGGSARSPVQSFYLFYLAFAVDLVFIPVTWVSRRLVQLIDKGVMSISGDSNSKAQRARDNVTTITRLVFIALLIAIPFHVYFAIYYTSNEFPRPSYDSFNFGDVYFHYVILVLTIMGLVYSARQSTNLCRCRRAGAEDLSS